MTRKSNLIASLTHERKPVRRGQSRLDDDDFPRISSTGSSSLDCGDNFELPASDDAWAKRPAAWTRLLTLDREDRYFDLSALEAAQGMRHFETQSSMSASSASGGQNHHTSTSSSRSMGRPASRAQTATPSYASNPRSKRPDSRPASHQGCKPLPPSTPRGRHFHRARRRVCGLQEAPPGWSLRYCELAGIAREPTEHNHMRRGALKAIPSPKELQDTFGDMQTADNSVFLANKGFDFRLAKFQDKAVPASRLVGRRNAITSFGQSKLQVNFACKMMTKNFPDRMSWLLKVNETKVSKGGNVVPVDTKQIPKDAMQVLCSKLAVAETEVRSMFQLFNHYDFDSSGSLDIDEVRNVLADLGLQPQNREEKAEVSDCIAEKIEELDTQEFGFEHFMELLQLVRDRLRQVQSIHCMHIFHEADEDCSESLDIDEVHSILGSKLGLKPHSTEEDHEINNIFRECDADGDGALNFDEFLTFVQKVRSRLLTMRRKEEMAIAKWFDLEPEILHEFRSDLPMLWETFKRYSFGNTDRGVHRDDVVALLADVGIAKIDSQDRTFKTVQLVANQFSKTYSNFIGILNIIREARRRCRENMQEELTAKFNSYDRAGSGVLTMHEIYLVLEEFKMLPRSKEEQAEVGRVIDALDRDGSGAFELHEFHDFFQKMTEQVRLPERQREHKAAMAMGISEDRFAILRRTFFQMNPDASSDVNGTVPQLSVLHMMSKLRSLMECGNIDEDELRVYTRAVQQAPELAINFLSFVNTVKLVLLDNVTHEEEAKDEDGNSVVATGSKGEKKKSGETRRSKSSKEDDKGSPLGHGQSTHRAPGPT